jgi:predicted ATPase/DNA-binding XRE family transcriptional regulator
MTVGGGPFGARLKALREAAGFTQEELATIAGLSVHAVSALERGERRRPQSETVRALCAAFDLTGAALSAFLASARAPAHTTAVAELGSVPLPPPPTTLRGREAEMATLRRWVADPASRLLTLIGPGGVGKTCLVLALARATAEEGGTRVVFVSLAAIQDPALVAPAVAEALGLTDIGATDLARRARAAFGDQRSLLVLDNFEHVLDAAPLVADLLGTVASLRMLVTSRAPLRVRGERELAVGPLAVEPGAEEMSPADLARVPAVHLFTERVRDVRPDFRLTPANGPTVAAICRRLDGLPLALELAAPWLKVLTPDALLRCLIEGVLLSPLGPRDLPERQQTMNATVAWSYQLLDPMEQRAFRRFGALPGLFPVDAAAEVLAGGEAARAAVDDALSAVARLIDKSLLLRAEFSAVATCPLYYMLETVRAYAALQLAATGERDDALEGLVRYCTGEASLAAHGLVGPAQVEWLDRAREDLDSYRVVLAWLVEQGRAGAAADIAWALLFFWLIRGHTAEGLRWFERISSLPSLPPAAEPRMMLGAAAMLHTHGELGRARTLLTRGVDLAHRTGDVAAVAQAAWMFGHVEFAAGNLDAAREWFVRSLAGFESLQVPWGAGAASSGLAWVALAAGDEREADRLVDVATAALQPAGPWFLALGLYVRVILTLRRGDIDGVIALMRKSLTRVRQFQDRFTVMYGLVPLAVAAGLKGDDAWVARILGARDVMAERTGFTLVDPFMRDGCAEAERGARSRLGADRWAQAYAVGRRSSIEAMIKDIDAALG